MSDMALSVGTAVWLGILTSISPCPLATNIAAISYLGRRVAHPRAVLFAGLLYTVGRTLAYVALAYLLVLGLLSAPYVSSFLQKYMIKVLGPLLIVTGMFLLELIHVNVGGSGMGSGLAQRAERWGLWGAAVMGLIFALAFCPVSAALFFGSLLPLALERQSGLLLPSLYGIGTALPVVVFAILVAFGANVVARAFAKITLIEKWARRLTGVVFIGIGVYFTLAYVFGVFR